MLSIMRIRGSACGLVSRSSQWLRFGAVLALATLVACGGGPGDPVIKDQPGLRILRFDVNSANVYIVEQGKVSLMIDAGNPGDEGEYERLMRDQGFDPASLDYLLLTHAHADHAGAAAYFQKRYGVEVIGGRDDQPLINARGRAELCPTSFVAKGIASIRSGKEYASFELDHSLDVDGGPFDLAKLGMTGMIWPSPGHTPGSVVAIVGDQAFVGDLIRGGMLEPTRPETHFFMCDLKENRQRIREVLDQAEVVQWHPGHMGPFAPDAVLAYLER